MATLKIISNCKVIVRDLKGNITDVKEFHNLIPTVGLNMVRDVLYGEAIAGTADATEANKLHDADGGFAATDVGKWLHNTTDDTWTTVSGYVDSGELDLTDDIMADTEDYVIYSLGNGILYMGVGDDNTAPALTDTTLGNETFRKVRTSRSKPADTQTKITVYIAPTEAVGAIEELGWFAGATAAAGANTGIMVSRVLFSRTKTNLESIQVERIDRIEEVF